MAFTENEKKLMLNLKGVGATVIKRLEQIGFSSLAQLENERAEEITKQVSEMMHSTCWHNSPQAKKTIQVIIDLAKAEKEMSKF